MDSSKKTSANTDNQNDSPESSNCFNQHYMMHESSDTKDSMELFWKKQNHFLWKLIN
jgi:hypothetical protein